jgi:hypothetical protein
MPAPVWPVSLPQKPLKAGFRETPPNLVVRSQTDVGPAKARRRATAGMTSFDMQFRLSAAQLATLRTFYNFDLQGGALAFTWTHPVTNAAGSFRIVQPPEIAPTAGVTWLVGVKMELLP